MIKPLLDLHIWPPPSLRCYNPPVQTGWLRLLLGGLKLTNQKDIWWRLTRVATSTCARKFEPVKCSFFFFFNGSNLHQADQRDLPCHSPLASTNGVEMNAGGQRRYCHLGATCRSTWWSETVSREIGACLLSPWWFGGLQEEKKIYHWAERVCLKERQLYWQEETITRTQLTYLVQFQSIWVLFS